MNSKDAVEKFRALPEAGRVPEEVWDVFKGEREIADLEGQLTEARRGREAAHCRALKFLQRDWSEDELREVGF